jgi:drug/metabolite transporter (DMT)-like permease
MPTRSHSSPFLGVAFKVVSALVFTMMGALIKLVGESFPTGEIVFFRSFFALVPLAAFLSVQGELATAIRTTRPLGHFLRGGIGVIAMFLNFAGIARLPLADATAIFYAAPIFTVALAALILKERVRIYRWSAVTIGFCGVVLTLLPHLGEGPSSGRESLGAVFSLSAAVIAAFAMIQVRRLTETERTGAIVLYFSLVSALFGLLTLPFGWVFPNGTEFAIMVAIGVLGGVAQICLTQSYRLGDASLIAPFEYSSMLFALAIGYVVFGEVPVTLVLAGAAITIGAGIFVILRERALGLERIEDPEVV